ncbi:arylsulfotransferase family protein [Gordonia bronchialis]|uniref:arylsulfotransferase family protein n=1 Tax=Gordonia bronchialis TaxID=2054 RepID=UPI001CC143D4|nr:arylsulfotransferase family protein [Gordonia bronchialis]
MSTPGGRAPALPGHGAGSYIIADKNFRVLRRLHTPAGTSGDLHEFRILPDGHRAAVTSYVHTTSVVRGVRVPVIDSRFYILDIDTDAAQFGWSSLRHVPVDATTTPLPIPGEGLDYFHINSVFPDGAGNYLISSRNTSALYLIDGRTGNVRATIGGVHSSLRVPDAARFANQHDAELRPDGTIRLFDNNASVPVLGGPSSILTLRPDWQHGTVRVCPASRLPIGSPPGPWAMPKPSLTVRCSAAGGPPGTSVRSVRTER